jgi:hypothetical protein
MCYKREVPPFILQTVSAWKRESRWLRNPQLSLVIPFTASVTYLSYPGHHIPLASPIAWSIVMLAITLQALIPFDYHIERRRLGLAIIEPAIFRYENDPDYSHKDLLNAYGKAVVTVGSFSIEFRFRGRWKR